ncbi:MAG: CapA family protein, partial [Candidatus Pacebacteria bacterium]|nr:CapA family protein [Candidatus Paceibacterota bacterium]
DTMLGRHVGERIEEGMDPFLHVREIMMSYDLVVMNLEGPITDNTQCQKKAYSFRFATNTATMLADSNVGLVTLANNHSFDCYSKGMIDTRQYLTKAGIGYFGGGGLEDSYTVREIEGRKIAFVGIDMSIGEIPISLFYPLVARLDKENDEVVVHIHWGNEYELNYSNSQQTIGHALVDKGVDLIIGHHPHVIQPVEIYKNKPIFYSLGNFIFDQFAEETTKGFAVEVVLGDDTQNFRILPYKIKDSQPAFLSEEETKVFCEDFLKNIKSENKSEETCSVEINS